MFDPLKFEPSTEDHSKGNKLADNQQYQEASEAYTSAIKLLDHENESWLSSVLYYNRGNVLAALAEHEDAIKDFQMALKSDGQPSAPKRDILKNMGNSRYAFMQFKAAYKDFEKAEEVMEGSDLNLAMGNCLVEMGKFQDALSCYKKNQLDQSPDKCETLCRENRRIIEDHQTSLREFPRVGLHGNQGNTGNIPYGNGYNRLNGPVVGNIPNPDSSQSQAG